MEICNLFGKNVKKYRLKSKLSQEKLGELTGLHRTYISDIERGLRSISLNNIDKLSKALNVEIYKLFIFEE
ncbi:MAG: helix-turn-helix domain-containing protein [Clostridia bacterium]|jgi:transcriptional regulator with XRE-family HTH domain